MSTRVKLDAPFDSAVSAQMITRRALIVGGGLAVPGGVLLLADAAPADADASYPADRYVLQVAGSGFLLASPAGTSTPFNDPTSALQSAVDALSTTGGTILVTGGSYPWSGPVELPPDLPAPLRILGDGGAVIQLSAQAPRAFDFGQTGAYQTFQNIEIGCLAIDGGGVGGMQQHVVLGTTTSVPTSPYCQNINVEDLYLHDLVAYNIPVVQAQSNFRSAINITLFQPAVGESQQNWVKRVTVERVQVTGANVAVSVGGDGPTGGNLNAFIDDIFIQDCSHDTGIVPTIGPWGASFQVGMRGFGGSVHVARCYSRGSGDTAVEVNGMSDALIEGCVAEEVRGFAFYLTNYRPPAHNGQQVTWRDCSVVRQQSSSGYGFRCDYNAGVPLGHVSVENCHYYRSTPDLDIVGEVAMFNAPMLTASIRGLSATFDGIDDQASSVTNSMLVGTGNGASIDAVVIRDVHVSMTGSKSGTAPAEVTIITLNGIQQFLVENVRLDGSLTNWAPNFVRILQIGEFTGSSLNGVVRNIRGSLQGAQQQHVWVGGSSTLTIPDRIRISDIDATASTTQNAVTFYDQTNVPKVFLDNVITSAAPQPSSVSVGTSPFVYQNLSGKTELVVLAGNGISKVELSSDAQTFVSAGAVTGMFTLPHTAALRITYTQTTPTLTLLPTP
jgi:hypothetical protein